MGDVNDVHEQLKNLIEKSSIPWTYGILWECCSQRRVLRFKDGYHRGSGKGNPKQVQIMGSCITVTEHATDNDNDAATQWFFNISMSQSFEINQDLPGHVVKVQTGVWMNAQDRDSDPRYKWGMWERTKWAQHFGIRTLLCLPLQDKMVLELASTQIITYNIQWMLHYVRLIYHRIGTLTRQQQQLLHHYAEQQRLLALWGEFNEGAVNEKKNESCKREDK